jgi:hypothetical protein
VANRDRLGVEQNLSHLMQAGQQVPRGDQIGTWSSGQSVDLLDEGVESAGENLDLLGGLKSGYDPQRDPPAVIIDDNGHRLVQTLGAPAAYGFAEEVQLFARLSVGLARSIGRRTQVELLSQLGRRLAEGLVVESGWLSDLDSGHRQSLGDRSAGGNVGDHGLLYFGCPNGELGRSRDAYLAGLHRLHQSGDASYEHESRLLDSPGAHAELHGGLGGGFTLRSLWCSRSSPSPIAGVRREFLDSPGRSQGALTGALNVVLAFRWNW